MSTRNLEKEKILSENLFPVVGVGASAGGLDAFKRFVRSVHIDSGMAYILVQHLHPDHNSLLPEILQRETQVPVKQIIDKVEVQPDNIYIIPANKMLVANDGILELSPRPEGDKRNMPIDIFFTSLADVHQKHAIGIILSGTGSDGTNGLKNIKAKGGITMAQDPTGSQNDAMPQSAIDAEVIDYILAPESMPQHLLDLDVVSLSGSDPKPAPLDEAEEKSFKIILKLLRVRHGVDFTYYKQTTVRRRVLRRLSILKIESFSDYQEYLKITTTELDILFQDLLIPVTSFFRDPKSFDHLSETALPEILKSKATGSPLRVWIAGCSTGEEAYSLAICLHEYFSDKGAMRIQIFATDISERSILKARSGVYGTKEIEGLSKTRLELYFVKMDVGFQVKKIIRDMCIFATHNFLKDPPFAKIDLLLCRNVLIYMEPFLQKKAFATFHYALNDKGYLMLGKSETAGTISDLFQPVGKVDKIYTRKPHPGRVMYMGGERQEPIVKERNSGSSQQNKPDDYQHSADQLIISRYAPSAVIVNEQFDIVQFRGSTGDYLEPSPGKASLNVLKMVREGLSFELRNALHKAKATNEIITKDGIIITNGKKKITIEVIPLLENIDLHYLILFRDTIPVLLDMPGDQLQAATEVGNEKDERINQLERELQLLREDMRTISEDQEAANEELQSANEELLSGSEELQSLNEELETSKEELQSTNEELIIVNQELFDRNDQLNQARLYAEAIVTTIHEPLIILNEDFRIISVNQSFIKTFVIPEDEAVGKALFDLQDQQWHIPGMHEKLRQVQREKSKFLEWEVTYLFPSVGTRTICFNAQPIEKGNGENWILLAMNDLTLWKEKEEMERKIAGNLRTILETLPHLTFTALPNGSMNYFNQFYLDFAGTTLPEAIEIGWEPLIKPEMLGEVKKSWSHAMIAGEPFDMELQLKRNSDGMFRWHLFRASCIKNEAGDITSWVGAATDIHDQKTKEEAKDEFISIASHELKTPLTTAKAYIQLLKQSITGADTKELLYVQKANTSIERLNNLIAELMDVSKIQNGKFMLSLEMFDFNEMLAASIDDVQHSSPKFKIIKTGQADRMVMGDIMRLQQVMINLLTNAVKYSPGTDTIIVNVIEDKNGVRVSVTDQGIGIRKENTTKIFERYYREDGRALHFQGLGIGLSICKEIIQRHNGKIWVESVVGEGSTFYFTIPF